MDNDVQILSISFLVVLIFLGIAVAKVGFAAYGSVFGGTEFEYKFDKTRLPQWGKSVLGVIGICLVYAWVATGRIGDAIGFCLLVMPFVMLGCLLSVCYVPRNAEKKKKR